ncbi:MAG: DUF3459 domain-containing protein, partial [Spartobacteria bacterium]|nr:DUF3459 domain-containing protein [Spartobacteria bacterium]
PMIYAGQEFGEDSKKRVGWNHLDWSLLNRNQGRRLHNQARALIRLRRRHPALRGDQLEILVNDPERGLAVYRRGDADMPVIVALNLSRQPVEDAVDLPPEAQWREVLSGTDVGFGQHAYRLEPGEAKVWAATVQSPAQE